MTNDHSAELDALVAAFISDAGLSAEQQRQVHRLGWTPDEFAVFAAMASLEADE
jgi:hypothetical protein